MSPQLSLATFQFLSTCEYYVTTALTSHIPVPLNLWVLCLHSSHWPHSSSSQLVSIMSPQLSLTKFQYLSTCEYYVTTALTDHIPVPLNLWVLQHYSSHWPHSSSSQLVSITSPQLSLTTFQFLSTCKYYITTALTDHIPVPQLVRITSPQLSLTTFQFLPTCQYYITTALTDSIQFLSTCQYFVTTALTDHIPVPLNLWVLHHHSSHWQHSSSSQLVSITSPQLSLTAFQFLPTCQYYITTALADHNPVPLNLWGLHHHSSHWQHSSSSQLVSITSPQLSLTAFQFLSTCEYYITTALTDHIPVPFNLWVLCHHSSHWQHSSSSQLASITSPQLSQTTFQFLSTCEYYVTTAVTDHIPVPINLSVLHHFSSYWPHSSSFQLVSIMSPQLSLTTFQFLPTCQYYITTALIGHIPVPLNLWVLCHHSCHWPHSSSYQLVSITSLQLLLTTFQFLSTCEYYVTTALTDHIPVTFNLWVLCHHSSHWPHSSSFQLVCIMSPQLSLTTFQFLSTCEYYVTTALTGHIPLPLNLWVLCHHSSHWPHSSSSQLVSIMSPQLSLTTFQFLSTCEYYVTTALIDHIPVPLNLWVLCHHSSHWPLSSSSQIVSIMSPQLSLTTFQFLSTCEYYVTTALIDHIPVPLNLWVLCHHSSHWPHSSSSQLVSIMSPQLSLTTFQFLSTCEYYVTTALIDHIPVPLNLWVLLLVHNRLQQFIFCSDTTKFSFCLKPTTSNEMKIFSSFWYFHLQRSINCQFTY